MLQLYTFLTRLGAPLLSFLLDMRVKKGKEDPARLGERKGLAARARPDGVLAWIHAASVGEAQSILILVDRLLAANKNLHVMVTTGTLTSAALMAQKLPARAFHQFYPLDCPSWTARFLDHWRPDLAIWVESELWPNMLGEIRRRGIPAALVNARLSDRSFARWSAFKGAAQNLLGAFSIVLAQTERDAQRYKTLGVSQALAAGNLKFSAEPLAAAAEDLAALRAAVGMRPVWLFASTHKGEEEMACRIHAALKVMLPDLLTIIVPRHPERRVQIMESCAPSGLILQLRGGEKAPPAAKTDIYITDTLGELGLFYTLAGVACIGRSFSDDGGGGHNPIEAAQLDCAVLYGPNVQNQTDIYMEMDAAGAALAMQDEAHMTQILGTLLTNPEKLAAQQAAGRRYAQDKAAVIERVMKGLEPLLERSKILS